MMEHDTPRLIVGISLSKHLMLATFSESDTKRSTYFRPVCEYTFTEPSCIPTAQKEFVAFRVNAGEGK